MREWAGPRADHGIARARVFGSMAQMLATMRESQGHAPTFERFVVQSDGAREFALFCRFAYTAGNLTAVIDEAHLWCRHGYAPEELLSLNRLSRHRGVDLVLIAQRPHGLAVDLRDQRSRLHLFPLTGEASLQWVRNECGAEAEKRLRSLPARGFLDL